MDNQDRELKRILNNELGELRLSPERTRAIQAAMQAELCLPRNWRQRAVARIQEFLDTTYEVKLYPAAAALGVILLVTVIGVNGVDETPQTPARPVYYAQQNRQPDGTLQVVLIPVSKEVR